MMKVNMYSVVEKDSSDTGLIISFDSKAKAEAHAGFLNDSTPESYIVVPSEINLCEPVNQLGVE